MPMYTAPLHRLPEPSTPVPCGVKLNEPPEPQKVKAPLVEKPSGSLLIELRVKETSEGKVI